uniref:Secreted protein n=1 Tax=Macrostomum lignano TaxID=282301 RepID=A0A1I8FKY4_9PLAT
ELPSGRADGPELEPPCARWRHAVLSVPSGRRRPARRGLVLYGGRTPTDCCLADATWPSGRPAAAVTARSAAWLGGTAAQPGAALLARRLRPPPAGRWPSSASGLSLEEAAMMEMPASASSALRPHVGPVAAGTFWPGSGTRLTSLAACRSVRVCPSPASDTRCTAWPLPSSERQRHLRGASNWLICFGGAVATSRTPPAPPAAR